MEKELLFLRPELKERIWGGQKLVQEYGYQGAGKDVAVGESWNISALPGGDCEILNGTFQGCTLSQLYREHRELFGGIDFPEFPLLVKMIDARDDLSIQVHPEDAYAREKENCPYGKMECWYIMDCQEGAALVMGHKAKTREELTEMIEQNRYEELITEIPVKKGDMLQINPGTIHAIKGGFLILETQQSSDITYRVYDYGRLQDGKPRPLHVKQSLEVIRVPGELEEKDIHPGKDVEENSLLLINECEYYRVWQAKIKGSLCIDMEAMEAPFYTAVVLNGSGSIDGEAVVKGSSLIVPAGYGKAEFSGEMEILFSSIA